MNPQTGLLWAAVLRIILSLLLCLSDAKSACDLKSSFEGKWYLPDEDRGILDDYGFGQARRSSQLTVDMHDCRKEVSDPTHPLYKSAQYIWAPEACTYQYTYPSNEFAKWFLRRFSKKDLLFYGDSTARQVATALMRLMYQGKRKSQVSWSRKSEEELVKTDSTKVSFIRSNYLARTKASGRRTRVFIGELDPRIHRTIQRCPAFIFVGTGAWWGLKANIIYSFPNGTEVDVEEAIFENTIRVIPEMGRMCPSSKLIILDAYLPHWTVPKGVAADADGYSRESFCSATVPLSYGSTKDVEVMKLRRETHASRNLSWVLDHHTIPNGVYVTLENFLLQRADMHVGNMYLNKSYDCLHYCEPGPLEYAAVMLMQAIDAQFGSPV